MTQKMPKVNKIDELKINLQQRKINYAKEVIPLKRQLFKLKREEFIKGVKSHHNDCRVFRKENKKTFLILDLLLIIMILCNLGALLITNALVVRVEPNIELMEANPVVAEIDSFEMHPEATGLFKSFIRYVILWSFFTFMYFLIRNNTRSYFLMYFLMFYVILYSITLSTDFINDLGYYIGKKLW